MYESDFLCTSEVFLNDGWAVSKESPSSSSDFSDSFGDQSITSNFLFCLLSVIYEINKIIFMSANIPTRTQKKIIVAVGITLRSIFFLFYLY